MTPGASVACGLSGHRSAFVGDRPIKNPLPTRFASHFEVCSAGARSVRWALAGQFCERPSIVERAALSRKPCKTILDTPKSGLLRQKTPPATSEARPYRNVTHWSDFRTRPYRRIGQDSGMAPSESIM